MNFCVSPKEIINFWCSFAGWLGFVADLPRVQGPPSNSNQPFWPLLGNPNCNSNFTLISLEVCTVLGRKTRSHPKIVRVGNHYLKQGVLYVMRCWMVVLVNMNPKKNELILNPEKLVSRSWLNRNQTNKPSMVEEWNPGSPLEIFRRGNNSSIQLPTIWGNQIHQIPPTESRYQIKLALTFAENRGKVWAAGRLKIA